MRTIFYAKNVELNDKIVKIKHLTRLRQRLKLIAYFQITSLIFLQLLYESNTAIIKETIPTSDFYCYTIESGTPTSMYGWKADLLPSAENEVLAHHTDKKMFTI